METGDLREAFFAVGVCLSVTCVLLAGLFLFVWLIENAYIQ